MVIPDLTVRVVGVEIRQKVCTSRADGSDQRVAYGVRMRKYEFGVCF